MKLWNNRTEIKFFKETLKSFGSPEKLFYKLDSEYYAYIPKSVKGEGKTLQSRNSPIGKFTEKWAKDLFAPIAKEFGLYAVNGVICEEIGLSKRSNADLAFCTSNNVNQKHEDIKIIFEIKMSIVSNYKLKPPNRIEYIGDYKSHKGNPSLLRSDSMLKAIGKSINIRVSGIESAKIPIIILGNSPITESYSAKVDLLKTAGVIQGFLSLNPAHTESGCIRNTDKKGFQTIEDIDILKNLCSDLLGQKLTYFSSMLPKTRLGELISISNREKSDEEKAEKFLNMIREV